MSDFIGLAQTFGLPLAMTIIAVAILARALVVISKEKDRIADARYDDMKLQFEARLKEQREQYQHQIKEMTDDRDWNRDHLHQSLGLADASTMTIEEVVRRIAKRELPPQR